MMEMLALGAVRQIVPPEQPDAVRYALVHSTEMPAPVLETPGRKIGAEIAPA